MKDLLVIDKNVLRPLERERRLILETQAFLLRAGLYIILPPNTRWATSSKNRPFGYVRPFQIDLSAHLSSFMRDFTFCHIENLESLETLYVEQRLWSSCADVLFCDISHLIFWCSELQLGSLRFVNYNRYNPTSTWPLCNVTSTSMQRHYVSSSLTRRCFNAMRLLGIQISSQTEL